MSTPAPEPTPARAPREWIIDQVLPRRVVALLVGPPGVSKTTAAIQWLASIRAGEDVFGHKTTPTEIVFVSCDRSQEEHEQHVHALEYDPSIFHFHDQVDIRTSIERVVRGCAAQYPRASLLFIDGFARLLPNGKPNDYNEVSDFLCQCGALARQFNKTIIGCLHAGKVREGQGYLDPRDTTCGSTAWAGFSNLMIVMQKSDPKNPADLIRDVHVLTRAGSGDFSIKLQKDPSRGGRLSPWEEVVDDVAILNITWWLAKQDMDRLISTKEFIRIGTEFKISKRAMERWLPQQVEAGVLHWVRQGVYQRVRMQ